MSIDVTVLDRYAAAWIEKDEGRRMELLDTCWGTDAVYTDPENQVLGRNALSACIATYQSAGPGLDLTPTSGVDEHHGQLRVSWQLANPDGGPPQEGMSFGAIGKDGLLQSMTGFPGPFPEVDQG